MFLQMVFWMFFLFHLKPRRVYSKLEDKISAKEEERMLEKFLNAAREEGLLPYGMELRMDDIVAESWEQTPGRRYPVYSAAKSFTASAVGMAVDEGKLSLEDPLERYFEPELNQAGGDTGKFWRQVTLRRLLTMTIPGLPFRPSGDDWLADCFSKMPDLERGVCFS